MHKSIIAIGLVLACFTPGPAQCQSSVATNSPGENASGKTGDATPIPAVKATPMELIEIKPTALVNVTAARSRVFRTKGKISRVSVSDPSIAEAVVVSEHEFILLGKRDGAITLVLWSEENKPSLY